MPVTDGVVAHGEKIEAGGDPVDKPGFQAAEHAVAGKHIGGGEIEIAGGGIEAADGQILPGFRLNGFLQIFLRGAEELKSPKEENQSRLPQRAEWAVVTAPRERPAKAR